MKYRLNFYLIFLLFISHRSMSQDSFVDGYIMTLSNDTIKGQINYIKKWPYKVVFKDSRGDKKTYSAGEIKGYCQLNVFKFISVIGAEERPFFASVIVEGPATILRTSFARFANTGGSGYIYDHTEYHYFLLHIDKSGINEFNERSFTNDIAKYFSDYPELQEMILNKQFNYDDINVIVKKYNEWYLTNNHPDN